MAYADESDKTDKSSSPKVNTDDEPVPNRESAALASLPKADTRIEVYQDHIGEYRWRLVNIQNGKILADGSESYVSKSNLVRALNQLRKVNLAKTPVAEVSLTQGERTLLQGQLNKEHGSERIDE